MVQKVRTGKSGQPDSRQADSGTNGAGQLEYMTGFANEFASEAIAGTLPVGQNSPQKVKHGLYAEQLSGTAFTAARHENRRTWLYRIRPSVLHGKFKQIDNRLLRYKPFDEVVPTPNQLRWDPLPLPKEPTDFVQGLVTIAGNGDLTATRGSAVHLYAINKSMTDRFFYNADGELLLVPQSGALVLRTECGVMNVAPGEIAVLPRGMKFQVQLGEDQASGYVCENFGPHFRLPALGPIGANGLANARDFETPVACYEDLSANCKLVSKFCGNLFEATIDHSPLDVVAWHGNYVPYKYDLNRFSAVNTVTFDHNDPSIFTVLTSPSEFPGTANCDFVIFPSRWLVAERSFRPPYFHRNVMSEYMGLIHGSYDAKQDGFVPGGGSLHNCMSAHGPDAATFDKASTVDLKPTYMDGTLAFMFESSMVYAPTRFAAETPLLQLDYRHCWDGLKSNFKPES